MNTQQIQRSSVIIGIFGGILGIGWIYIFFTQSVDAATWTTIGYTIFPVIALLAIVNIVLKIRASAKSDTRNSYLGFFIAWVFFFLGESTWFVYGIILNTTPPTRMEADPVHSI